MAKTADQQLAQALYQLTATVDAGDLPSVLDKFATYLNSIGAITRWPVIAELYRQHWQRNHGVIDAEIVSTRPLDKKSLAELSDQLAAITSAEKIQIQTKIDPDILGGVIIRLPDRLLDASYRRQLRNLQAKLLY
mgnify:CR=1 FL=1